MTLRTTSSGTSLSAEIARAFGVLQSHGLAHVSGARPGAERQKFGKPSEWKAVRDTR